MLGIWSSQSRIFLSCLDYFFQRNSSFRGKTATQFLEWLTPSSLSSLKPYSSTLSVLLNENGGIIDDTIVTKHARDTFYVVTNAGCREKDLAWFKTKLGEWNAGRGKEGPVEHEILDDWGLVALQGWNNLFVLGHDLITVNRSSSSVISTRIDLFRYQTTCFWYLCLYPSRRV